MDERLTAFKKAKDPQGHTSTDQKVQFMRVPVAGFAGNELDAQQLSKDQQEHEQKSLLVFEDTSELAHASGALIPGSLRENALNRAWLKLDFQKLGKIDNLLTAAANSLVVIQNHSNHVADLTAYERGLIEYAMPRLRDVIDREGSLAKHKFITICRKCLTGSQQMLEYMEKSEAQVYANLAPQHVHGHHDDAPSTPAGRGRFDPGSPKTAGSSTPMPLKARGRMSVMRSPAFDKSKDHASGRLDADTAEFVTTGSALKLMLDRIFDKLDVHGQGYLDETPDASQGSLTSFESALIELAQFRLQYELKAGGVLQKAQVVEILRETMDQDYPLGDEDETKNEAYPVKDKPQRKAHRGYPPLETAMRSVYREARKFRSEKPDLSTEERQRLECTFHPMINYNPTGPMHATSAARSRHQIFAGSGTRSMSTKDMKEYVELQECTFAPNLYKHLSNTKTRVHKAMYDFDPDHPQYRTKRRDANILVKELQKREHLEGHAAGALHMHGCRGKLYWQETLRQDNAESQFTSNERADPEDRIKPDAGMDLGMRKERHNFKPAIAEPRDWGKYIRVNDVRYGAVMDFKTSGVEHGYDTQDPEEAEVASKAFAETFLSMRQSRGRMRSRGVFM
jgi:hypothetical protein